MVAGTWLKGGEFTPSKNDSSLDDKK